MSAFSIRPAQRGDTPVILEYIRRIAHYEKMDDQVVATEKGLETSLFDRQEAFVLLAEEDGQPVGFALYFTNFSTFIGRSGLHLEDLYVDEEKRGKGYGKALFRAVTAEAVRRGCQRMEWACLDWNTPSIAFYHHMGATAMSDWTTYRLAGGAIAAAVEK